GGPPRRDRPTVDTVVRPTLVKFFTSQRALYATPERARSRPAHRICTSWARGFRTARSGRADRPVQRDDPAGQVPPGHLAPAGLLQHRGQCRLVGPGPDGLGEVDVGLRVR